MTITIISCSFIRITQHFISFGCFFKIFFGTFITGVSVRVILHSNFAIGFFYFFGRRAFCHTGDYAQSLMEDPVESFAFFEESMELSRRFRALKLWLSLRYHGLGKFRQAIDDDLKNAQLLVSLIKARPELEILAPVPLSAVCFRHVARSGPTAEIDALNQSILQRIVRRGKVFLSNATIQGQFALRACFVNHRTTPQDVEQIVSEVIAAGCELANGAES